MVKSRNYVATPPGATIKEQLIDIGLSQKEFAIRMNLSEKHISKLINGEVQLTPDVAVRLETVLGVPAKFWNKLEAIYREKLIKANAENEMEADIKFAKNLPYKEMSKYGWVPETNDLKQRVVFLRKFFGVVKLESLNNAELNKIACRRFGETEKADWALLAWAQKARLEARSIDTAPINTRKLKKIIVTIRTMTNEVPEKFTYKLCQILAECGIALILLPHIGGSFLHGATFRENKKIIIGLTVRGKDSDKFWFSLFHEIGHIILGHINQADGTTAEDEAAADAYAQNVLIPKEDYSLFVACKNFSAESIIEFAEATGVAPGIVVGRLQKEHILKYNQLNNLKTMNIPVR